MRVTANLTLLLLAALPGWAQLPRIPLPGGIKLPNVSVESLLREPAPLTTSLADALVNLPELDNWEPALAALPDGGLQLHEGRFVLPGAGRYHLSLQSYCLHAGTHGPGQGEGYLHAPLKGARADAIRSILRRSAEHPELDQHQIQLLIWAILSRSNLAKSHRDLMGTARVLLTAKEITALSGGVWGSLPDSVQNRVIHEAGPVLGPILETEAKLRRTFSARNLPGYDEIERIAVLTDELADDPNVPQIPRARWSYDPTQRLFVRYNPHGYSRTEVDVYVPERWTIGRDALRRISSLADGHGNRIETIYDDTIAPFTNERAPGLRGYAYSALRFVRRNPDTGAEQVREIKAPGWTFVGRPGKRTRQGFGGGLFFADNAGQLAAGPRFAVDLGGLKDRFDDWQERYDQANELKDRWDRINDHFDHQGNEGAIDDLTDIGHYQDGLDKATNADMFDKGDWIADHLARVVNAWNYCIDKLGGLLDDGDDADSEHEFDPSEHAAVPSHTGRQRLGQSARLR